MKTKIASDVASLASGDASCIQNPLFRTAVTTPGTNDVRCPVNGDMCAAPWISWIRYVGAAVANDDEWLASILSGGSFSSASVTPLAKTVTVHVSFWPKSVSLSSV